MSTRPPITPRCTKGIKQLSFSKTCYFNGPLNALILSDNFQSILVREWYNFLKAEQPFDISEWNNTNYSLSNKYYTQVFQTPINSIEDIEKQEQSIRFRIARHALFKVFYHVLCDKPEPTLFKLGLKNEPKTIACAIMHTTQRNSLKEVTKGGFPFTSFKALIHTLYQSDYEKKVKIINIRDPMIWSDPPLSENVEVCIFIVNEDTTNTKIKGMSARISSYGANINIDNHHHDLIVKYMKPNPHMNLDHCAISINSFAIQHTIVGIMCEGIPIIVDSMKPQEIINQEWRYGLSGVNLGYTKCLKNECGYAYICYVKAPLRTSNSEQKNKQICSLA